MIEIYKSSAVKGKQPWHFSAEKKTPKDFGVEPIAVTDKDIKMDSILIIKDKAYTVCWMSGVDGDYRTAYVDEAEIQDVYILNAEPQPQQYTDEITCPYCGYEIGDSWECPDHDDKYECPGCMSHFSYSRNVEVTYSSEPKTKNEPTII